MYNISYILFKSYPIFPFSELLFTKGFSKNYFKNPIFTKSSILMYNIRCILFKSYPIFPFSELLFTTEFY